MASGGAGGFRSFLGAWRREAPLSTSKPSKDQVVPPGGCFSGEPPRRWQFHTSSGQLPSSIDTIETCLLDERRRPGGRRRRQSPGCIPANHILGRVLAIRGGDVARLAAIPRPGKTAGTGTANFLRRQSGDVDKVSGRGAGFPPKPLLSRGFVGFPHVSVDIHSKQVSGWTRKTGRPKGAP